MPKMLLRVLAGIVLCGSVGGVVQAQDAASRSQTPLAQLRAIADTLAIDDPGVPPWHWQMDVTLYDRDGKNPQPGKIEAWFADGSMRSTLTLGGKTLSTLRVGDKLYEAEGQDPTAFVPLETAFMDALRPVPDKVFNLTTDWKREPLAFGKAKLDCIEPIIVKVPTTTVSFDTPLAYCLSPSTGAFVGALQPSRTLLSEKQMGTFHAHRVTVAMDVVVMEKVRAEIKTVSLAGYTPAADEFAIPANYRPLDTRVTAPADHVTAMILSKAVPSYPQSAKDVRASGSVQFDAVIGLEGRVISLKTSSKVHAALMAEAERVIRSWVFRPYLVNGVPVTVTTTLTINFNMG